MNQNALYAWMGQVVTVVMAIKQVVLVVIVQMTITVAMVAAIAVIVKALLLDHQTVVDLMLVVITEQIIVIVNAVLVIVTKAHVIAHLVVALMIAINKIAARLAVGDHVRVGDLSELAEAGAERVVRRVVGQVADVKAVVHALLSIG